MARPDQDESIPFFAPATAPTRDEVTEKDADDLTTLQSVQKILESSLEDLKMDVTKLDADDLKKLQAQILGKQEAYAILEPVKQMIDSAIESVMQQRKGLV